MRSRLAPSDTRKAISGRRAAPRASSRLARFAHAISSSTPTADEQRRQRIRELDARRRGAARARLEMEPLIQIVGAAFAGGIGAVERLQAGLKDRVGLALRLRERHAGLQPSEYVEPHHLVGGRVVQPIGAGQHDRRGVERQPQIGLLAGGFADEAARRDADDRRGASAHRERLADHVGPAAEASLPVGVADHRVRRARAVVVVGEDAADGGADAEHLEESTRYQTPARFFPGATVESGGATC